MSMSEVFSVPFLTLIKLCYTKAREWSSLVPGSKGKSSSSDITNLTSFTVSCHWDIPPQELLLLLSRFSCVQLCATPETAAHQAPPSQGFSRQEHWSGLPFPSPMHESEKEKWSHSVVSDSQRSHGLQPTRLLCPWDFPGKSTGVGCHCLLHNKDLLCSRELCPASCGSLDGIVVRGSLDTWIYTYIAEIIHLKLSTWSYQNIVNLLCCNVNEEVKREKKRMPVSTF